MELGELETEVLRAVRTLGSAWTQRTFDDSAWTGGFTAIGYETTVPGFAVRYFKAAGTVRGIQAVSARIELAYFNLADKQAELAALDAKLIEHHQARWSVLHSPKTRIEA